MRTMGICLATNHLAASFWNTINSLQHNGNSGTEKRRKRLETMKQHLKLHTLRAAEIKQERGKRKASAIAVEDEDEEEEQEEKTAEIEIEIEGEMEEAKEEEKRERGVEENG